MVGVGCGFIFFDGFSVILLKVWAGPVRNFAECKLNFINPHPLQFAIMYYTLFQQERRFFMQILTTFNMTPREYLKNYHTITINRPEKCPICGICHSFYSHGCYWRNIIEDLYEERIPVARFCCKICGQTVSMLPSFALPYFQYSLEFILKALNIIFKVASEHLNSLSALYYFYRRRFFHNINRIEMFFRDHGCLDASPAEAKEKAIKIICTLTFPKAETFSQRFLNSYKLNFMAR